MGPVLRPLTESPYRRPCHSDSLYSESLGYLTVGWWHVARAQQMSRAPLLVSPHDSIIWASLHNAQGMR